MHPPATPIVPEAVVSQFQQISATYSQPAAGYLGESVTYTPKGDTAVSITDAIIDRTPLAVVDEDGQVAFEYPVNIKIRRSLVTSVNVNGDKVALKQRVSDASNSTMTVGHIISQEGGVWHLGLQ